MDVQRRILIPEKLRKVAGLKKSSEIVLCMKKHTLFFLVNIDEVSSEDIIIKFAKMDDRGRIIFPYKYLPNTCKEIVFLRGNRVYISFSDSICI